MKHSLTLQDRFNISMFLPKEGSYEKMLLAKDISGKIKVSQEEFKKYGIKTLPTGDLEWAIKFNDELFEYSFTDSEANLLVTVLKNLSEKEILHCTLISLYKKVVIDPSAKK